MRIEYIEKVSLWFGEVECAEMTIRVKNTEQNRNIKPLTILEFNGLEGKYEFRCPLNLGLEYDLGLAVKRIS